MAFRENIDSRTSSFLNTEISRRDLLRLGIKSTAAGTALFLGLKKLDQGIVFRDEETTAASLISISMLTMGQAQKIKDANFVTFGHRDGNFLKDIDEAARLNIDYVEADSVKYKGNIYFQHGKPRDIAGVLTISADFSNRVALKIGTADETVENTLRRAGEKNVGVNIDLKVNNNTEMFDRDDIRFFKEISSRYGVQLMFHSGRYDVLEMARHELSLLERDDENKTPVLNVAPSTNNENAWEELVFSQEQIVLFAKMDQIRHFRDKLTQRNASVIALDATTAWEVLELTEYPFVKGLMAPTKFVGHLPKNESSASE